MRKPLLTILLLSTGLLSPLAGAARTPGPLRMVASTYPIHLLAQGVVAGVEGVELELLLPASLGCPHDYSLTPEDLRKLETADILVINGLGMEEFLGSAAIRSRTGLRIVDASRGLKRVLPYSDDGEDHHGQGDGQSHGPHDPESHHHDAGPNPHYFASPRAAAAIMVHLAEELARVRPADGLRFRANAAMNAARLTALADDLRRTVERLPNRRIVTEHGVFDYLANDAGLEVVAVLAAHPGEQPSAAAMRRLVDRVKARRVGAIFAEPQYPAEVARTIARETGAPLATLDPVATGPEGAGLEHYLQVMDANRRVLERTLAGR